MVSLKTIPLFFILTTTLYAEPDCVDCDVQREVPQIPKPEKDLTEIFEKIGNLDTSSESKLEEAYYKKAKRMLTPERCELFSKMMNNIINNHHLLPSQALFNSLDYYYEQKNKAPISDTGKDLIESSKEFIEIVKKCEKQGKEDGLISWKVKTGRNKGKVLKKDCKKHIGGAGFHENLISDHEAKITSPIISIGNFDVESDMKRFFVINSETGEISSSKVSHGKGQGDGANQSRRLKYCTTSRGSTKDQTRPGFYKVTSRVLKQKKKDKAKYKGDYLTSGWPTACNEGTYNPKARRRKCGEGKANSYFNALRIVGLQNSNDDAYTSGVIMHGASYNPPSPDGFSVAGASHGCPAFSYKDFERIGQKLTSQKPGGSSLYYSYAPVCGGVEKDISQRVKRVASFKKNLSKKYKVINKKLKRTLGSSYLKSFNTNLNKQGYLYEQLGSVRSKYAEDWGDRLKNKELLSTLDYLEKLKKSIDSKSDKSAKEIRALKYVNSLLDEGAGNGFLDENPFINFYMRSCEEIKNRL